MTRAVILTLLVQLLAVPPIKSVNVDHYIYEIENCLVSVNPRECVDDLSEYVSEDDKEVPVFDLVEASPVTLPASAPLYTHSSYSFFYTFSHPSQYPIPPPIENV